MNKKGGVMENRTPNLHIVNTKIELVLETTVLSVSRFVRGLGLAVISVLMLPEGLQSLPLGSILKPLRSLDEWSYSCSQENRFQILLLYWILMLSLI